MSTRQYPSRPFVGVGGIVFIDGRVVLVKRRHEPLAGQWSLPGGAIELGETLHEGLRRELREEIGIETSVGPLVELFDRITHDTEGRVRYHYVLADYLCHHLSGELRPGSDAEAVALADPDDLSSYAVTETATAVIRRAVDLAVQGESPGSHRDR
ncbi:MAG: NUDIX hydrolase [Acidobacteria bacterium]|nr:NUDIX hydrolase [Acidobacteriota bacterium]